VLAADVGTGEVLISMIGFFLFLLWFVLLFYVFADIIRSHDLSGWGKAIWTFLIIFLPYLAIFAYLVIRGHGMAARQAGGQVSGSDPYAVDIVGRDNSADELLKLAELHNSGKIDDADFAAAKARVLG
jgi:Phospholipase_D-nuclease N-terminal